jgi:hypothetical protein
MGSSADSDSPGWVRLELHFGAAWVDLVDDIFGATQLVTYLPLSPSLLCLIITNPNI